MESTTPATGPAGPFIKARFLSNEDESWEPGEAQMASTSTSTSTSTPDAAKRQFSEFLQEQLLELKKKAQEQKRSDKYDVFNRLFYNSLLSIARDPSSTIPALTLAQNLQDRQSRHVRFKNVLTTLRGPFTMLYEVYDNNARSGDQRGGPSGGKEDNEEEKKGEKKERKETKGRSASDKKAQQVVPQWYGEACVFCGFPDPHGAHIVPVRAMARETPSAMSFSLESFWTRFAVADHELERAIDGQETRNILPLCPNTHILWDSYRFAIRPIRDQVNPERRLLLQFLWLNGPATPIVSNVLSDFRREHFESYPGIKHGDVYELTTDDPAAHPLPSARLLHIQLGAHKLMAGVRAAAAAGEIFYGEPPDDDDDGRPIPSNFMALSPLWEEALDAAVKGRVLDEAAAERWRMGLLRGEYRTYRYLAHGDDGDDGDDSDGEEAPNDEVWDSDA